VAQTIPIITISNVVASIDMRQKINLDDITKNFPHTEYIPKNFPGLFFRLKDPKTVTIIFGTGKMVCTGAKSEDLIRIAVTHVIKDLLSKKIIIKNNVDIIIRNMVGSANLKGRIDLVKTATTLANSMYEPDQFPSVIYRVINPKSVNQIFASGKIVCTGTKNEDDLYRSVNNLHSDLEKNNLISYD